MRQATRVLGWFVRPEEVELAIANLWLGDTLGVQTIEDTRGVRLAAWFSARAEPPVGERNWPAPSARLIEDRLQESEDWLAEYRRVSRPFPVATRFQVDPREPVDRRPLRSEGRWLLSIPARGAFGVGSHPSTSLVIEMLEALPLAGSAVLDVGCGTGILSFAALRLGAESAVGLDIEPEAAAAAHENAMRNGIDGRFLAGRIGAVSENATFDIVLANVLPERLRAELSEVLRHVSATGSVLLSGLLEQQVPELLTRLATYGFTCVDDRRDGEWVALRCMRSVA